MNPWMQATGWTLVHFIWQGGLLAVATAAGLRLSRRRSPEARYAIACIGLATMLASAAVTASVFWAPGPVRLPGGNILSGVPVSDVTLTMLPGASDVVSPVKSSVFALTTTRLEAFLSFVVWAWLAGVTLFLMRFAGGCWRVHRVRVASLAEVVSPWQSASERLAVRLRLDVPFRVVESSLVDVPTVIGWVRPMILLPLAALTNLTPMQIEALLAHELAHIRRRDYAVNLLQTLAETLLFYHPGVWWVSTRIREAREQCCDDVAVELCDEPATYAAALAELASWRGRDPSLAVGAADGAVLRRVRRLLHVDEDTAPRSMTGFVVLAVSVSLAAVVVAQSSAQAAATRAQGGGARVRNTDHFDIHYPSDLDLHADRVAREAERAYAHVSDDLKHNLGFKVPLVLFHSTTELERSTQEGRLRAPHVTSLAEPSRDRILLAVDLPADRWYGLITHEVAHVFLFDIVPGTSTPRWIAEGLAEYQRGSWDPGDLVALREAVRVNAIPRMSGVPDAGATDSRLAYSFGHAVFDFIESRWGKAGVRQYVFWLRQTLLNGGDPHERVLQLGRDEFDREFDRYLRGRFARVAGPSEAERFDSRATVRVEGDVTAINASAAVGLACLELWVPAEGGTRQRWGLECGGTTHKGLVRALKAGDRVIVTGAPARPPAVQRMLVESLERPSDGLTWRADSR
jgi:beta-lactamase regulating signal transducer with metallopeptidase domain